MKYGARNNLQGKVIEISKGGIMCKVKVEIAPNAIISSVMTIESLEELGLKVGDSVQTIVKAVNVLLVKE